MKQKQNTKTEKAIPSKERKGHSGRSPREASSRFKVHAHMDIPVAAELIIEANSATEAGKLAVGLLQDGPVLERLHKLIAIQTVSVPIQSNQQVGIRFESLLLDIGPEVSAWKMVDLNSGEHWEPLFEKTPTVKAEDNLEVESS
jgi:hypothetical protein